MGKQDVVGSSRRPLRVAIVGTGYIADFHARAISGHPDLELAGAVDTNIRSAEAFASRWSIPHAFETLQALLQATAIDSIHLLVPPNAHFELAKQALDAGVNVFVEKPMCTSVVEADELVRIAAERQKYLGVNHNFLFSSGYQRLRKALSSGEIGPINHIDIRYLFDMPHLRFGPFDAWMLREPGNLILETGPHLFSAVLDLFGEPAGFSVIADREVQLPGGGRAFRRWRARSTVGAADLNINIDFGPGFLQRQIYVRGLYGAATYDFDADVCTIDCCTPLDADLDRYSRNIRLALQVSNQASAVLLRNILGKLKLSSRGNPFQTSISDGIRSYYSAMMQLQPLDRRIDCRSGQQVIRICNEMIDSAGIARRNKAASLAAPTVSKQPNILVLGGSGFIGRELIRQLLDSGHGVRAMIRGNGALLSDLSERGLAIVKGDIRSETDLRSAMLGIEYVYHLAHAPAKTWLEYQELDVEPTRLVAKICLERNIKRLIYTGTISSYYTGHGVGTITEKTPLDPQIQHRDYYSRAKAAAENLLLDLRRTTGLNVVIFRPGIVIGPSGTPFHWGVGRFIGNYCQVWGDGRNKLPFVLVSDVAAALARALEVANIDGESYNLIDSPMFSARDYLDELQRKSGLKLKVSYRPIWKFYAADLAKWLVKVAVRHPDAARIPRYFDWESRTQLGIFDCEKARSDLGWRPASDPVRLAEEGIGQAFTEWSSAMR